MPDFWNKVNDGLQKGLDTVIDTTGNLVNKGKDAIDEGKLKYEREKKCKELGEMFYEMMQADNLNIAALQDKCEEISQIDAQMPKE